MNLLKKSRLFFQQGNSDKVYEVDLCELSGQQDNRYLVNFRYGKRGQGLREGTKTPEPVDYTKACKLFDSVVVSKTNKGYADNPEDSGSVESSSVIRSASSDQGTSNILEKLCSKFEDIEKLSSKEELKSKLRARLIWRLGELGNPQALKSILKHRVKEQWLESYSTAWAIARCNDSSAMPELERLQSSSHAQVSFIAKEARLHTLGKHQRALEVSEVISGLPEILGTAIKTCDATRTMQSETLLKLVQYFTSQENAAKNNNNLIVDLYRATYINDAFHSVFNRFLKDIPLKPNVFKGIRQIYKIAEMKLDVVTFAMLAYRFDNTKEYFSADYDFVYIPGQGSLKPSKELQKLDSRLAYSAKTRTYLRRRSWRCLRKMAELGNENYIKLASAILLTVNDSDAHAIRSSMWGQEYPRFAVFNAFNHILYGNSAVLAPGRTGKAWVQSANETHQERTESFPELWNKQAKSIISLLVSSNCLPVHQFSTRFMQDHPELHTEFSVSDLVAMLSKPYEETNQCAVDICKQRLAQEDYNRELSLALLGSGLITARELIAEHLKRNRDSWKSDSEFIAKQLFIDYLDVTEWRNEVFTDNFSQRLSLSQQEKVQDQIIALSFEKNILSQGQYENISAFLSSQLNDVSSKVSFPVINRFVDSDQEQLQCLGAQFLLLNKSEFQDIPAALYQKIIQSPFASVRSIGVAILAKQSDSDLLKQPLAVLGIFQYGEKLEREEAAKIIQRLANKSNEFSQTTFSELLGMAFRSEELEGQHEDVVKLFTIDLKPHWALIDDNQLWRLSQAQCKAAKNIAAVILIESVFEQRMNNYSIRQWVMLADHEDHRIRDLVCKCYTKQVAKIKQNSKEALMIFDSNWNDSREFASAFFREQFSVEDWTEELIIFLCDNNREDVQAFGRELLQNFFKIEQGENYLLKLSQHPSINTQLFASNFLQEHAGGKPDVITSLEQYFLTVLSQINKARICKDRVFKFLQTEALQDSKVANMAAAIFTRQSLTAVAKDKAKIMQAMLILKQAYPEIDVAVSAKQRPLWTKSVGAASVTNTQTQKEFGSSVV